MYVKVSLNPMQLKIDKLHAKVTALAWWKAHFIILESQIIIFVLQQ